MAKSLEELMQRRDELRDRIKAIHADIGRDERRYVRLLISWPGEKADGYGEF